MSNIVRFINLTQVPNYMISAQAIFTFRRLSAFTVSFTRILQEIMQKVKPFSTVLLTSQVVLVQSLQLRGPEFESIQDLVWFFFGFFFCIFTSLFDSFNFIIIDIPRPLSNVF